MFNARLINGNKIEVSGDVGTVWSCFVHGNFGLEKYSGKIGITRTDEIDVIVPDIFPYASGKVLFSHDDDHCDYIEVPLFFRNECYVVTTPSYNENGNIVFLFESTGQTFSVDFETYWGVQDVAFESGCDGYFSDGTVLVYPTGEDNGKAVVTICDTKKINILLCKKNAEGS